MGRMSSLFRRRASRQSTPAPPSINEPLTDEEEGTLRAAVMSMPKSSRNYNWFAKRVRPRQDSLVRYQLSDDVRSSSDDFRVAGLDSDSSGIFTSAETPDSVDRSTPRTQSDQQPSPVPQSQQDPETENLGELMRLPQNSALNDAIQQYINQTVDVKVNSMISQLVAKILEQQRIKRTNRLSCLSTFSTLSLEQDQGQGLWPIQEHETDASESIVTTPTALDVRPLDAVHELPTPTTPTVFDISHLDSGQELLTLNDTYSFDSDTTPRQLDSREYTVDLARDDMGASKLRVSSPSPNILLAMTRQSTPGQSIPLRFRSSFCASTLPMSILEEGTQYLEDESQVGQRLNKHLRRHTEPFADFQTRDSFEPKLPPLSIPKASVVEHPTAMESSSELSPNSVFTAEYDSSAFETSPEAPDLSPSDNAKLRWLNKIDYQLDTNAAEDVSSDSASIDDCAMMPRVDQGTWEEGEMSPEPRSHNAYVHGRPKSMPVVYGQSLVQLSDTHYGYYIHSSPRTLSVGYVSPYPVPLMAQPVYYAPTYHDRPALLPIDEMFEFELPLEYQQLNQRRHPLSSRYKRWQDPSHHVNETACQNVLGSQ